MGWAVGYDDDRNRDVGYGVPAVCDHPGCAAEIDRGLGYRCGGTHNLTHDDIGCGLFFCYDHLWWKSYDDRETSASVCARCVQGEDPFEEWSPDTPEWVTWKLTDESWMDWRGENPDEVANLRAALAAEGGE